MSLLTVSWLFFSNSCLACFPYTCCHFPPKPAEFLPPSSLDTLSTGEKAGNRSTRSPSRPAVEADEPADTQSTLAQTETLLSLMTVLDVMLPYGFAAMMGLSQALPAEHCRLWFKESIFHSDCSQWCSQQGQTAEPGLYTPTHALFSHCHLEILSPIIQWSWLFCYNKLLNASP